MDGAEYLHRFVDKARISSQMELRRTRSCHWALKQTQSSSGPPNADIAAALVAAAAQGAVPGIAD